MESPSEYGAWLPRPPLSLPLLRLQLILAMRLLVIGTTIDTPEAHILHGLIMRGVYIHFLGTPLPEHRALIESAGASVTEHDFAHRFDLKGISLIRDIVRKDAIDVVYALSNRGLSCSVIGLWNSTIPIATYRGTVGHLSWFDPSAWLTFLSPKVKKILCVSEAVSQYLREMKVSQEKIVTIYKGHDVAWYRSTPPPRASLGLPDDAFVVGCTAMMRPVKGVDILIQAVSSLLQELPKLHLLLIGGIKDPVIEELLSRFPDKDRLHLTGYRKDATQLATLCDVTVMASKTREGFPKSVIEAMAQGVPAIVTNVGGMPELVGHGNAGVVVSPSNVSELAEAIRMLSNDRQRTRELGRLGQDRIREVFNVTTTIEKMHGIFSELQKTARAL
jgi:glycosyltransferase involved in cell wall biosynthesis